MYVAIDARTECVLLISGILTARRRDLLQLIAWEKNYFLVQDVITHLLRRAKLSQCKIYIIFLFACRIYLVVSL